MRYEDYMATLGPTSTQYEIGYGNGLRDAQTGAIGCHDGSQWPDTDPEYVQGWRDGYDDATLGVPEGKDG